MHTSFLYVHAGIACSYCVHQSPWASLLETKFSLEAQSQPSQPPNQPGDPPGTSLVQQQPHVSSIPEGQQLWRQLQQQSEGQQLRQLQQQERMRAMEAQVGSGEGHDGIWQTISQNQKQGC
jgi:hypothetical protein